MDGWSIGARRRAREDLRAMMQPSAGKASRLRKADFPQKTCLACDRPFTWRKKWARDWPLVRYCSERCRRSRRDRTGGQR